MTPTTGRFKGFSNSDGSGRVVFGGVRTLAGWVGSGRVGSGRVGSGRVGSGRVGSGPVGRGGSDRVAVKKMNS